MEHLKTQEGAEEAVKEIADHIKWMGQAGVHEIEEEVIVWSRPPTTEAVPDSKCVVRFTAEAH